MALRAIIFDLSETIVRKNGSAVADVVKLIAHLRERGLKVAIAANESQSVARNALSRSGIIVDYLMCPDTIHVRKPSPRYCEAAAEEFGISLDELIYVGDSDATDALVCANAGVLYLAALWANPTPRYGIPVKDANNVWRFIRRFLMTEPQWYWVLDRLDKRARPVVVRALWKEMKGSWSGAKRVLKLDDDTSLDGRSLRGFLFRLLLTRLYLDGLTRGIDLWCWYPGSKLGGKSAKLLEPLQAAARLFKDPYLPDLLLRHTPAVKLASARYGGGERPTILTQVNTVCLNPAYTAAQRRRIDGKRIMVVDDFATEGLSFECARNLLYAAGAARVECVAFGRFWDEYVIHVPRKGLAFDPWSPANRFVEGDFEVETVRGLINYEATAQHERLFNLEIPALP